MGKKLRLNFKALVAFSDDNLPLDSELFLDFKSIQILLNNLNDRYEKNLFTIEPIVLNDYKVSNNIMVISFINFEYLDSMDYHLQALYNASDNTIKIIFNKDGLDYFKSVLKILALKKDHEHFQTEEWGIGNLTSGFTKDNLFLINQLTIYSSE